MTAVLNWFGDEVIATIRDDVDKKLARIGIAWTSEASTKLKVLQNRDGTTPSPRGGYPAEFTSQLAKQVASAGWELVDTRRGRAVRVGTNLVHGRVLETSLDRPWMSLTNMNMMGRMRAIVAEEIK